MIYSNTINILKLETNESFWLGMEKKCSLKKELKEERDLSLQRKKSYRRTRSLSTTTRPLSSTSLLKQLVIKNNLVCTICKTYELAKIIKPSNINLELIIYPSLTLQSQSYCVHLRHTLYAWKKHLLGQPFDSKQR